MNLIGGWERPQCRLGTRDGEALGESPWTKEDQGLAQNEAGEGSRGQVT